VANNENVTVISAGTGSLPSSEIINSDAPMVLNELFTATQEVSTPPPIEKDSITKIQRALLNHVMDKKTKIVIEAFESISKAVHNIKTLPPAKSLRTKEILAADEKGKENLRRTIKKTITKLDDFFEVLAKGYRDSNSEGYDPLGNAAKTNKPSYQTT